jgi:serine protease AprX
MAEQTTTLRARIGAGMVATAVAVLAGLAAVPATASATDYDPVSDVYSMASTAEVVGAEAWWDAGYTGAGIDVAVIDTGVSPVEGLAAPGKVIYGPDLSLESQAGNLRNFDTYGHGTFMAGLIAGRDSSLTAPYSAAPASAYRGIAPDARIVSIKVATADGGADVTQVIAAINWVMEHRYDNGLNIRIINLSYGTNTRQSSEIDPLSYAVEQAWKAGIVVVAAAGNTGYQRGEGAPGLANPAYNPWVIAVGGYDSKGTVSTSDDVMGSYSASSAGCGSCKKPDFVAVGSRLQGLRVPNSFIDGAAPGGRLGERYFRGSGTSQAAAIASGSIALILQKHPTMTPNQVKKFITGDVAKVPGASSEAQGAGEIRLAKLLTVKAPGAFTPKHRNGTGLGSVDASRGSDRLTKDGVVLNGEVDIFGKPFNAALVAQLTATGSTWSGGMWNGSTWSGSTWSGSTWSGSTWSGSSWSGSSWSGSTWSGSTWSGSTWSGSTWSGSSWSGSSWSGGAWATGSWG